MFQVFEVFEVFEVSQMFKVSAHPTFTLTCSQVPYLHQLCGSKAFFYLLPCKKEGCSESDYISSASMLPNDLYMIINFLQ